MINALVGRPGCGKSYEAVRYHVIPALQSGRYVVTNMSLQVDDIAIYFGENCRDKIILVEAKMHEFGLKRPFSEAEDFTKYGESYRNSKGQGPLFVIDEAHLSFGSDSKKEVLEYASLHRHYGHDWMVITQNLRKVHRDIRDMVEITWRCIKNSAGGKDDEYIQKQYMGSNTGRGGDELSTEFRTYDPSYFKFYQSHTKSNKSILEAVANDVKGSLKPSNKMIKIIMVLGILISLGAGSKMLSGFGNSNENEEAVKTKKTVNQPDKKTITESTVKPKVEVEERKPESRLQRRLKMDHPYAKMDLFISGFAEMTFKGNIVRQYYIGVSRNGSFMFEMKDSDLWKAGYTVDVLNDCLIYYEYETYSNFITCETPSIGQDIASVSN